MNLLTVPPCLAAIADISEMMALTCSIAWVASPAAPWIAPICMAISSVALAVWPARLLTSEATTAKPRPASPALLAGAAAVDVNVPDGTPLGGQVFFCNSGAEANECAIKLARKWGAKLKGGAHEIITFDHAFHGRTLATMAASGKAGWDKLFEPKVPGFPKAVLNDLASVEGVVTERTVAVMLEPIQGEAGVLPATDEFLRELREIDAEVPVIVLTAHGTVATAVEAMKIGAFDYVQKPFEIEEMELKVEKAIEHRRLKHEIEYLRHTQQDIYDFDRIVGASGAPRGSGNGLTGCWKASGAACCNICMPGCRPAVSWASLIMAARWSSGGAPRSVIKSWRMRSGPRTSSMPWMPPTLVSAPYSSS